jgi:hypothetical protein
VALCVNGNDIPIRYDGALKEVMQSLWGT